MRVIYIFVLIFAAGCRSQAPSTAPQQGIEGEIWWLEGDFMPRIDEKPQGQKKPVRREVVFYEVVRLEDPGMETGPVFSSIPGKEVASVMTGDDGGFRVALPVGTYSVFTKEPEGYFANSFDGEGRVNPVTVKEGEMTQIIIEINYQATY